MYFFYSFLLTIGFLLLLPRFLWDLARKGKYAEGFWQRFGYLPEFDRQDKKIVWLHCVSVGETNAVKPLARAILEDFPNYLFIVSTTTKTGQTLAQDIFKNSAALIFYFPFDWAFIVRRVLRKIKPELVLIMETELWFNFLREAKRQNVKLALVNGRLSEKSFKNYSLIRGLMRKALSNLDLALMSGEADAQRIIDLGCDLRRVFVTGNVKFDLGIEHNELTNYFQERFNNDKPFIIAASTHEPEENIILSAFNQIKTVCRDKQVNANLENTLATANSFNYRLLIAPRHPERFDRVAELINKSGFSLVRRSNETSADDKSADVILLDSVGELRAVYPLATIVFVGGSLIPHGGQNVLEPAAAQKAIVTGFYTMNFAAIIKTFLERNALVQLPKLAENKAPDALAQIFLDLLEDQIRRETLANNAFTVLQSNAGATRKTLLLLKNLF